MQKYKEINGNDYVKNSRTTINETMQSIQSMNSGTAFPTNNLFEGMKCYRTDLKKTYTLTDVENNTWVEDAHATLSDEATHAASATKLQTARSLNLGGAVTADAATFDGTANATINVKTLDATKLKGTASVSTTGNAATATKVVATAAAGASANIAEATMASSDYARIRVSGNDNAGELALETADNGSEPIVARQYTGAYTNAVRTAKILDESGNTSFPGTVVAPKFTGALSGNAATATKLSTERKINITGNATGSAGFDGTSDVNINVTVNSATKATNDGNGANIAANYVKKSVKLTTENLNDIHTPGLYFCNMDVNATTARNYPTGRASAVIVTKDGANGDDSCTQLCMPCLGNGIYKRQYDPGASKWSTWRSVAFTDSNVASASKLAAARTISLTGNATGSASFDGTSDVSINVTVNSATKATNDGNGANIASTYVKKAGDTTTGKITFESTDLNALPEVKKTSDDNMSGVRFSSKTKFLGAVGKRLSNGEDLLNLRSDNSTTDVVLDSRNYGSYALPKSGGNMSGPLNFANATWNLVGDDSYIGGHDIGGTFCVKGANGETGIALVNEGNEDDYARISYGGGNINFNKTIGGNISGNAATASKLATARAISLTGNASGSANFDGSGNVSINTTVSMAAEANSATKLANNGNRNDLANGTKAMSGLSVYQCYLNTGYPQQYGNVVSIGGTGDNELFLGWEYDSRLLYRARRDTDTNWKNWRAIAFTDEINNYAPTKTGAGASGTWGINISGNAASATNADKLDGYHASDLLGKIQGVLPKTAAEVGQFRELVVNDSHQIKLPDGGTWAYFVYTYNSWSGGDSNSEHRTRTGAGIAAGGTVLHTDGNITSNTINAFKLSGTTGAGGADDNNIIVGGFCWRIA